MKTIQRSILLLCIVLFLLTGCSSSVSEPPMLTISSEETSVQAVRSTYSWQNGSIGVEADGPHPLDMAEELPILEVSEDGNVSLEFAARPDRITVLAWKVSAAGTSTYDTPEFSLPVSDAHTMILPSDDQYLYEVHATWEIQDHNGGDAYYGFASAPKEQQNLTDAS